MRFGSALGFIAGAVIASMGASTGALGQQPHSDVLEEAPPEEADPAQLCGPHLYGFTGETVACVKVTVTLEGRATDCVVMISSSDPALDERTCAAAEEHARFEPALNDLGEPVVEDYHMWLKLGPDGRPDPGHPWPDIRYSYPSRALRQAEEGAVGIHVRIGKNGRVRNCTVILSSGSAILDAASCEQTTRLGQFEPAYDETGEPVEAEYTKLLQWRLY